jgi:hypothetical protein
MKYNGVPQKCAGNEYDTNLMPRAAPRRVRYLTDIEFCKFIPRRMFGYDINLRMPSA